MLGGLGSVALLFVLAQVQVGVEVMSEARGGHAPLLSGEAPRGGVAATLRPGAEVRLRLLGDSHLSLQYAPVLNWRYPNELGSSRPLVLHTAAITASSAVNPQTNLGARASVSAGEADYAALPRLLGTTQGALPEVLELLVASAAVNGERVISPRWRLRAELVYTHRRALNQPEPPVPDPGLPPGAVAPLDLGLVRQNVVHLQPTVTHRLTMRDEFMLESGLTWESLGSDIELYRVQPRAGWRRRLSPGQELRLLAGVAYTHETGTRLASGQLNDISPVAEVSHRGVLLRTIGFDLAGTFGLQLEHYVDPVLATAGPRALASAELSALLGQNWRVGVEALFGTGMQGDPLPGEPDETFVALSLPVRHRASPYLILEAGVRYSDRAPHLAADSFDFHQREIWLYFGVTATTFPLGGFRPEFTGTDTPAPTRPPTPTTTTPTTTTPDQPDQPDDHHRDGTADDAATDDDDAPRQSMNWRRLNTGWCTMEGRRSPWP